MTTTYILKELTEPIRDSSGLDYRKELNEAQYEAASRQMMAAIADLRDRAVGGVGTAEARRPLQIH